MKSQPRKARWLWAALATVGLLAGGYGFFQYRIVDTQLRPLIEKELTQAVQSPVSIRSVRAGLLGDVLLNDVSLTVPGYPWESRLTVERISVNVKLFDLLFHRKPLPQCLERISFIRPQILLARHPGPAPAAAGPLPLSASGPSSVTVPIPFIPVPELSIQDGSFAIQGDRVPTEVLNRLNFRAFNENGNAWSVTLSAHSPEADSQGTIRFVGSLHQDNFKVSGKALLEHWPLASAGSVLKGLTGWELTGGTVTAEAPIVFQPGRPLWFDAQADLDQAAMRSPAPVAIAFSQISGRAQIRPTGLNVSNEIHFSVGGTPWRASGSLPFDGRPISVRTSTDQLLLSGVFNSVLKIKDIKADGKGTAILAVAGPISDPVVEGHAELGPSFVGPWQMDSLSVKAGYEKKTFRLYDAQGQLYDGNFSANGSMAMGDADAPISLTAFLKNIKAKQVAAALGLPHMEGGGDVEVHLGGTLNRPTLSATSQVELIRLLRGTPFHYSIRNTAQMKDQKLEISAVINDRSRLEAVFWNKTDAWEMQRLSLVTGKKTGRFQGKGTWPKSGDQPIDIQVHGKDISLQDLPFLSDQFPDIVGRVRLDAQVGGTPKEPTASFHLFSPEIRLGDLGPLPMDVSLAWKPAELTFEKLTVGGILSAEGKLGLSSEKPWDLKMDAQGIPLRIVAEVLDWNNPPQPFEGMMTGHLHFTGLRKNPIVEGNGTLQSLKVGDWYADRADALLAMDQGKLQVKKLKFFQGKKFLSAVGTWDTRSQPGLMALHFSADDFQLGKGPFLSGNFQWEARTGDPWWKSWDGTFSSPLFALKDVKKNSYKFTDFSTTASFADSVLKGKVKLGAHIGGTAVLDFTGAAPRIQALLKVDPALLSDEPDLTQFLPPSLKVAGEISGELKLDPGGFDQLPMRGSFVVTNGKIQNYDFDRMELALNGTKPRISLKLSLNRDQAQYALAGRLQSPRAFWDSDSQVKINGPFQKERLSNILSLIGVNTEQHKVGGNVDGNLSVAGRLYDPAIGFSVTGENLRYDNNIVPAAELHFSESGGKILLGQNNKVTLLKGQIQVDKGSLYLDPQDPSVVVMDLFGSTQNLPIAIFNFTSQIHLSGKLALEDKEDRPTFGGLLSVIETGRDGKGQTSFNVALAVHHKVLEFKPMDNGKAQLVGRVDLSQDQKIVFDNLHLEHTTGSFAVDGNLDLAGPCHLVSDAKNVPIEDIGKWILPDFPLSGTGSYHLVFDGTLEDPLFTTSISVTGGKVGDLKFDLLDGELKSKNNTLYLGDEDSPLTLSRQGLFTFTAHGKMPFALTRTGWLKVHDREMDVRANMDKGDFGIILLAGLARKASGNMDFSAHVTGTLDDPVLTLDLDLQKCQMVPSLVAQSIDDISGHIKVRDNKLVVQDLNGRIGQGRVFVSSPPLEETKMVLSDFIPQYLDFRVKTVGDHGLWLSIPTIMDKGEWGEIYFYGATPDDPLIIQGPLEEPHVKGTAKLDSGHYTFPPKEASDDRGQKIEYRELAGVYFELTLLSGKNTWYSNDFASQYLELQIDPGDHIKITGKDADRGTEKGGIKCEGDAGSKHGWLRYLGHEFQLQEASLYIPKGKLPNMQGYATDRFYGANVITAGGVRPADVDVRVDFNGPFGNINFKLDSTPPFAPPNYGDASQKILLSYIMFGTDMTGMTTGNATYTTDELRSAYQQRVGQVVSQTALDFIDRIASSSLTSYARPWAQRVLGTEVDVKTNIGGTGPNAVPTAGVSQIGPDALGNSLAAGSIPVVQLKLRKPLDQRLSVLYNLGLTKDLSTENLGVQNQVGLQYDLNKNLSLNAITGQNDVGQAETRLTAQFSESLPDLMGPKAGDKDKPKFIRLDFDSIGPGKFHLVWETDKVTKCEVRVLNAEGTVVRDVVEKQQHAYDHEIDIEGLDPEAGYKLQISAKDLNQNEKIETRDLPPSAG